MTEGTSTVADQGKGKYRTAIILAVLAVGLFTFTLYSGLK